jgi:hypothetical protein
MDHWPQHVPWLFGWVGFLAGPLLGLGVWWSEGPSAKRKPQLSPGSDDDAVWNANYSLNRVLLALAWGSSFTFAFATLLFGSFRSPVDFAGAFLCGFLTLPLAFWLVTRPQTLSRYRGYRRFNQLRYGYNATSVFVLGLTWVLALAWLAYVLLRV